MLISSIILTTLVWIVDCSITKCYDCASYKKGMCFTPQMNNDTNIASCTQPYCYQQKSIHEGGLYIKRGCARTGDFCNMMREHKGRIIFCQVCEELLCNSANTDNTVSILFSLLFVMAIIN